MAIRSAGPPEAIQVYPSAALSLARGHLPQAGSGGPGTLLDNRPSAEGQPASGSREQFDITDLLRAWADGGPFPSGRTIPAHTPVVLTLQTPDLTDGTYSTTFAAIPAPQVLITAQPGCT